MKGNLWMEIRSEKKKGLSYAEIGRKHHIDPRTAKKYAETEEVPKYTLKQKRPSKLDPYKDYIDALLEEDNYSAALILERIRERGCQCGYTIVKDCVFSFASSAAYTPCCVFFEEKTDMYARLLHGYFLVSFFNYRFYEFKFSLRFFTVIINPVPERIDSINSHTIGVLSPVLVTSSFLSVPLDGLSSEVFALMVNVVLAEPFNQIPIC